MINVIVGDTNTFTAHAYGVLDPMTVDWCNQRAMAVRETLMPEVRAAFETMKGTVFDSIAYSDVARMAKAASRSLGALWQEDNIRLLSTIGELQHTPATMIPWVMAHPTIRKLYQEQSIAGFDDLYFDPIPHDTDEENQMYRAVRNGVFLPTGNEDEEVAVEYLAEFEEVGLTLDIYDQQSILDTWEHMLAHIRAGKEDPTSRYNAML